MATEKSSSADAETSNDSKDSAQNGSKEQVAKPNGSKPSADEIRKRAFEAFQARHGEPGSALEDWQKAESSLSAEATNASKPETDAPKPVTAKADAPEADTSKGDGAKADVPKANGIKPEAAKADSSKAEAPKLMRPRRMRLRQTGQRQMLLKVL